MMKPETSQNKLTEEEKAHLRLWPAPRLRNGLPGWKRCSGLHIDRALCKVHRISNNPGV